MGLEPPSLDRPVVNYTFRPVLLSPTLFFPFAAAAAAAMWSAGSDSGTGCNVGVLMVAVVVVVVVAVAECGPLDIGGGCPRWGRHSDGGSDDDPEVEEGPDASTGMNSHSQSLWMRSVSL